MARQQVLMTLAMILATMLWARAIAQSNDCTNVLMSMSPCLNYIAGNSSAPSAACCTQLGSVVRSQPQCLCQLPNGGGSNLGLNINQTRAVALPQTCNVQTPLVSRCNGNGSKNVPSSGDGSSDATSAYKLTFSMLIFLVITSSYASVFNMA
ncbi:hypothetical protein CDL12_25805 [Handroanthus impetiginosus]|uniref:Bifunctional inhibitor/plant lipid transfer protein/seed storage helical domain-containing protein n=1 Tax=Handroanthus impetiginosus TaxID=429701 RepID=A0A2G9G8R9_9LAMI|nr:hypothetical protein CDL12_25805 [Handroanthus impetiginosus]